VFPWSYTLYVFSFWAKAKKKVARRRNLLPLAQSGQRQKAKGNPQSASLTQLTPQERSDWLGGRGACGSSFAKGAKGHGCKEK